MCIYVLNKIVYAECNFNFCYVDDIIILLTHSFQSVEM